MEEEEISLALIRTISNCVYTEINALLLLDTVANSNKHYFQMQDNKQLPTVYAKHNNYYTCIHYLCYTKCHCNVPCILLLWPCTLLLWSCTTPPPPSLCPLQPYAWGLVVQ